MTYSIDSSSLIGAWQRSYPIRRFPTFWDNVEALIRSGHLRATQEVLTELEKKADDLCSWARARASLFVEIDDAVWNAAQDILHNYPRLLDTRKNRSGADPFVIALARVNGLIVVSQEPATNKPDKPNIPDVCKGLHVDCYTWLDLLDKEGWTF